jgi:hypothetical protein
MTLQNYMVAYRLNPEELAGVFVQANSLEEAAGLIIGKEIIGEPTFSGVVKKKDIAFILEGVDASVYGHVQKTHLVNHLTVLEDQYAAQHIPNDPAALYYFFGGHHSAFPPPGLLKDYMTIHNAESHVRYALSSSSVKQP